MKTIDIELRKSQILNDVVAKMNVLGRTLEIDDKLKELAGYISSPDDNDTKPIVARAMTEGFDRVKSICQRYLVFGRTTDDNRLERMSTTEVVAEQTLELGTQEEEEGEANINKAFRQGCTYKVTVIADATSDAHVKVYKDIDGAPVFDETVDAGTLKSTQFTMTENASAIYVKGKGKFKIKVITNADVTMLLALSMPNGFNEGVTSHIKSCAHHIIVANILQEFLRDQSVDEAASYKADIAEQEGLLLKALNARRPFERRSHDWS